MITLAAAGTLQGKAGTASAITYTVSGDAVNSGNDTFQILGQGQLGTSVAAMVTAAASTVNLISDIHLSNTTGSAVANVILYINGTAAANQIITMTIPANGEATYTNYGWKVFDASGNLQTGLTTTLTGDVTGTGSTTIPTTVAKIQGTPVSSTAPTNGQVLQYVSASTQYIPESYGGDVHGGPSASVVAAIQGQPVSSTTPTTNQILKYYSGQWNVIQDAMFNVVAYGADPTGAANSTTAIQNAVNAAGVSGGIVWFPTGTYQINATILVNFQAVTLMGAGATYSADVGSNSGGSALTWAGNTTTPMIKVQPTGSGGTVAGNKGFRLTGLTLYGNGSAAIGVQLISCQGFHLTDWYIQDTTYVALDMNCLNDAAGLAGERDTTRGVVERGGIRIEDNTVAQTTYSGLTNGTAWSGVTTLTVGSTTGFSASGVLTVWGLDPNGHYQQLLLSYTGGGGGGTSFTGVAFVGTLTTTLTFTPLGAVGATGTPAITSSTITGLTSVQQTNAAACIGIRLDGSQAYDTAYVNFKQIQINNVNGVGVAMLNADDNYFDDAIINTANPTGHLNPPGMTLHGSTTSAAQTTRNNSFIGGSAGHGGTNNNLNGGIVSYGTAQGSTLAGQWAYGNITYTNPAIDNYWRDYGIANGEAPAGIGTGSAFVYNNNSTQFGKSFNSIVGNVPGMQLNANFTTTATTAAALTNLSFFMQANEAWYVEVDASYISGSASGTKFYLGVTSTTGLLVQGWLWATAGAVSTPLNQNVTTALLNANAGAATGTVITITNPIMMRFTIVNGTTAQALSIGAFGAAAGTTTVSAGSSLRAWKSQTV